MKKSLMKGMNLLLAGALSLLGFAGCEKDNNDEMRLEYGSPHVDYTVKGAVVNKATGKPVKGILVGYGSNGMYMYGVPPAIYLPKPKAVVTDENGEFKLTDKSYNLMDDEDQVRVSVVDVDGEANGLFQPEYLDVDFRKAERGGKPEGWYGGEYTVTVNVELTEAGNQ